MTQSCQPPTEKIIVITLLIKRKYTWLALSSTGVEMHAGFVDVTDIID